jgi:hypothetical protein
MQTTITIVRRTLPFKSKFGNKIAAKSSPARKPNKLAKLSIMGSKPIKKSIINVINALINASHGSIKYSQA